MTRRLFCALTFDEATRSELARTQGLVMAGLRAGSPTARSNLHLTLVFLGEVDDAGEAACRDALAEACAQTAPFDLELAGVGSFDKRRASVVWCGVLPDARGTQTLRTLQASLADGLVARGVPFERRPYVPHVTLVRGARARVRPDGTTPQVAEACEAASAQLSPVRCRVQTAHLMWSHHPEGGALAYTPVFSAPLGR